MKDNNLRNIVRDWFAILVFLLMLLLMDGCKSSKVVSDREAKDSVVYTYKTLYRDSLRVKDSAVIVYETVQRDSVVLRVDKATGEVLSTDSWHWKDTNRDRDHVSETKNKTEKSDSAASVAVKSDKRTAITKDSTKPLDVKKTHYWKTYWLGMLTGVLISIIIRFRTRIFSFLSFIKK